MLNQFVNSTSPTPAHGSGWLNTDIGHHLRPNLWTCDVSKSSPVWKTYLWQQPHCVTLAANAWDLAALYLGWEGMSPQQHFPNANKYSIHPCIIYSCSFLYGHGGLLEPIPAIFERKAWVYPEQVTNSLQGIKYSFKLNLNWYCNMKNSFAMLLPVSLYS